MMELTIQPNIKIILLEFIAGLGKDGLYAVILNSQGTQQHFANSAIDFVIFLGDAKYVWCGPPGLA